MGGIYLRGHGGFKRSSCGGQIKRGHIAWELNFEPHLSHNNDMRQSRECGEDLENLNPFPQHLPFRPHVEACVADSVRMRLM